MSRTTTQRWMAAAVAALTVAAVSAQQQRVPDPEPPTRGAAPPSALRPLVAGPNGGVSTGHPLVTSAALEILHKGGNAFDAGVASLIVGGVLEQDLYSLGGEALVLVYPVAEKKVTSVVGQGWAPKAVDVDWYLSRGKSLQGAGLDPAVVPGALHAALTVLEKWGTMSFETVSARAIEYARDGFPLRQSTADGVVRQLEFFKQWPDNQRYWLKADGTPHKAGETIKLPTLARTLTRMVEAERGAKGRGRAAGIAAARDRFYKGDIAKEMVAFLQKHQAPVRRQRLRRVLRPHRGAGVDHLPRLHRLQARVLEPGAGAAADAQHPRDVRPGGDAPRQRRLRAHRHRGDEAGLCRPRHLLRRHRVRAGAGRRAAVEGLRQGARGADQPAAGVAGVHRRRSAGARFQGEDLAVREVQHRRRHRHDRRPTMPRR